MKNHSRITIMETGLRDGLQIVEKYVTIQDRLTVINGLIDAGIKNIQVTSLVNPKKVPQMLEAEKLIKRLTHNEYVEYSALVFNQKGIERALKSGINKLETSISISESYNQKNLGLDNPQSLERLQNIIRSSLENNIKIRAGLQCVWDYGYDYKSIHKVIINIISSILELGVNRISLCDTSGMAKPESISSLLELIHYTFPGIHLCLHLHNTYGTGLDNLKHALQFDIKELDTSLGGIGGTPFIKGSKGNIATEDTINMLEKMGYDTGINVEKVSRYSRYLEYIIGECYFSGKFYNNT